MSRYEETGVRFVADLSSWSRNIRKAEKEADGVERAFEDAVEAANRLEKEMNSLRSGSVDVDVNIRGDDIQTLQNRLTGIADEPVNIDLDIIGDDLAGLETRLDQIADETVNIDVQALDDEIGTLKTRLRGIQDEPVNVDVAVDDAAIGTLQSDLTGIADEQVQIDVAVDDQPVTTLADLLAGIEDKRVAVAVDVDDDQIGTLKTRLRGIQDEPVNVDVSVDDAAIGTLETRLAGIADEIVTIRTNSDDSGVNEIRDRLADLEDAIVKIKTDADLSGIDETKDEIETLQKLAVIDLVLNLPGNLADIASQIESLPGIGAFEDQQAATRLLTARTGQDGQQYAQLVEDLYTNAWGESRQEIAEVIALSEQLGTSLDAPYLQDTGAAVFNAYRVAAATGQDVNDILRASNQLVDQELVPNYLAAADVIVSGFQSGANAGDDFLDTLIEYSTSFRDLGLSAEESTNLIVSGLEAGFMNTDLAADAMRELSIRLDEAVGDPEHEVNVALAQLGMENPRETGEQAGAEFIAGLFSAISQSEGGAMTPDQLLTTLVGTQSEDLGAEAVLALDAVEQRIGEIEGRANDAANAITGDLASALTVLFRTTEQEIVAFLESDAVGLPARIQAITDDINEVVGLLNEGYGLDQAIEIAFELPGFATGVDRLESIFGNLVLALSDLVIGVAELTGNEALAGGIRAARLPLVEAQLALDLQLANPENVVGIIDQALARGADPTHVGEQIQNAINEAVTQGDFGQGINILDALLESNLGQDVPGARENIQNQMNTLVQEAGQEFTTAIAEGNFDLAGGLLESIEATDNAPFAAGMRRLLEDSFFSALDSANFTGATDAADALADPALTAQLDARVEQFRQIGQSLLESGDVAGAIDYGQLIGDVDLLGAAFDRLTAASMGRIEQQGVMPIAAPAGGAGGGGTVWDQASAGVTGARETFEQEVPAISTQTANLQTDFLNTGTAATENLPLVSTEVALMAQNVIDSVTPANALLAEFIGNLQTAGEFSAGLDPNAASGGATTPPQTLDAGGPASAGVPYQVNGEVFIPPRDAYALGLPLSESLLGSIGGAGLGGNVTHTNITVNMNVNNNGAAARGASEGRLSNVVRGFA